jgi:hypothetical protein
MFLMFLKNPKKQKYLKYPSFHLYRLSLKFLMNLMSRLNLKYPKNLMLQTYPQ